MCSGAKDDPYLHYVADLNMTQCYKEMLLAGNPEIERYVPDPELYHKLRKDFVTKYPELAKEFKKIEPSDCIII